MADFRACPISVIQRSAPFEGQAEVILLESGENEEEYAGLEVEGRVVLTNGDLRRVWNQAVQKRGAIGILYDGLRPVEPVRPNGDLPDVRQYTSFWWQPSDTKCFGFVLSPRQGRRLRSLLKCSKPEGNEVVPQSLVVKASVASRFYDGTLDVISATIPGSRDQEVIVVSHLCHPKPSANDNASGVAAAAEAVLTLQKLIEADQIARPERTIRFLWLPEMFGSVAYLSSAEDRLDQMVGGLNLDMVGEDQDQTGSIWLIERPPDAAASYAPVLLARLRDEMPKLKGMTDISPSHTGLGGYRLYRQDETPFSGGSDHYVFSDPSVGVPMPMLIQWPDRFYHTSADTPDRASAHSLARSGSLASMYAYWLACAGTEEATWLGHEMVARFKQDLIATAQRAVTQCLDLVTGEAMSKAIVGLDRQFAYRLDRQKAALTSLERLAPVNCLVPDLWSEAQEAAEREFAWARGIIHLQAAACSLKSLPVLPSRTLTEVEEQAKAMIPKRLFRGPIPWQQHASRLPEAELDAFRAEVTALGTRTFYTLSSLAIYWTDGKRTLLEIADLLENETQKRDVDLLLSYFQILEKLGLVALQTNGPDLDQ
jgi:hypothetical protein